VECGPPEPGLWPAEPPGDRREWAVLLLRNFL